MAIVIKGLSKPTVLDPPPAPPAPPSAPAPEPTNPITAALSLSSGTASAPSTETPPWEVEENYTILDALKDMGTTLKRGKALWLVRKDNPAVKYLVRSWEASTSRAVLEGHKKSQLKPVLTEREAALYYPVWV